MKYTGLGICDDPSDDFHTAEVSQKAPRCGRAGYNAGSETELWIQLCWANIMQSRLCLQKGALRRLVPAAAVQLA